MESGDREVKVVLEDELVFRVKKTDRDKVYTGVGCRLTVWDGSHGCPCEANGMSGIFGEWLEVPEKVYVNVTGLWMSFDNGCWPMNKYVAGPDFRDDGC